MYFAHYGRAHRSHRWGHWFESSKHHPSPRSAMAKDFHILFMERKCPPCPNSSPRKKLGKKARRALDAEKRATWGFTPVTRKVENKKHYDRKKSAHV
nr:MAG TPA: hypothetical protein [Caudoviricetes sp.]